MKSNLRILKYLAQSVFLSAIFVAVFFVGASHASAATLYFNGGASDADWNTRVDNWWTDEEFTMQAPSLPTPSDDVIVSAGILFNTGPAASVNTLTVGGGGIEFSVSVIVANGAFFNDSTSILADNDPIITGDATFNDNSINGGTITGNADFYDSSINNTTGSVSGTATFYDTSHNESDPSMITNSPIFNDASFNTGTVSSDVTFNDESFNTGTVEGDATFNGDESENQGTVEGTKTRRYTEDIIINRNFVTTGPWTVVADGAVVNIAHATYDEDEESETFTTFQTLNGGSFSTEVITTPISSCADFIAINNNLEGDYILTTDLDCGEEGNDIMIAGDEGSFTGSFDGDGHIIDNITIDLEENYLGLFRNIGEGGLVENLGLTNVNIVSEEYDYIGALAGYVNIGTIQNSYSTGIVSGHGYVGGLIGINNYSTITSSHSEGIVTGSGEYVGGLMGSSGCSDEISDSYSTATVTGINQVGGLVGSEGGECAGPTYTNVYATGNIEGLDYIGGLFGSLGGGEIEIHNSYSTGDVVGESNIGGFAGQNYSLITSSFSAGSVTGLVNVGGFVGVNYSNIYNSYTTGSVEGQNSVGGFVGSVGGGNIFFSYATGSVQGNAEGEFGFIGGFAGVNSSFVYSSFSVGTVSTDEEFSPAGGFLGQNSLESDYENVGWWTGSGQVNAIGYDAVAEDSIPLITYNEADVGAFKNQTHAIYTTEIISEGELLYTHWDYDEVWTIDLEVNDGFPILQWQAEDDDDDEEEEEPEPEVTHRSSSGSSASTIAKNLSNILPPFNPNIPTPCTGGALFSITTGAPCSSINPPNNPLPSIPTNPSSPLCTLTLTLKQGSTGNQVKCLQTKLKIISDGIFGPITKASVIVFQKAHQLVPDGIVGPKTRGILNFNS